MEMGLPIIEQQVQTQPYRRVKMTLEKERAKVQKRTRSSWQVIRDLILTLNTKYTGIDLTVEIRQVENYNTRTTVKRQSSLKLSSQFC